MGKRVFSLFLKNHADWKRGSSFGIQKMPIIACPVIILARVHSRLTSFFCLFHWGNRQFRKIPMSFCWVATELFHWLWASLSSAGPPAKLLSTVPVELPGWSSMWPGQWLHPRKDSERSSQRPQFGRGGSLPMNFLGRMTTIELLLNLFGSRNTISLFGLMSFIMSF